jgi:hypothetical protein
LPEQDLALTLEKRQSEAYNTNTISVDHERNSKVLEENGKKIDFYIRKVQNERLVKPVAMADAKIPLT